MSCSKCKGDDDGCMVLIIVLLVAMFAHSCGYEKGYKEGLLKSSKIDGNHEMLVNTNEQR